MISAMDARNSRRRMFRFALIVGISLMVIVAVMVARSNEPQVSVAQVSAAGDAVLARQVMRAGGKTIALPMLRPTPEREAPDPAQSGVMSPQLADDLERFDGDQLRAELQSIALSYPAVSIGDVACARLPCQSDVHSTDAEQLNGFVAMVSNRFEGHLRTAFASADGDTTVAASLLIGTPQRYAPLRYQP
jgi:hypothetical protein